MFDPGKLQFTVEPRQALYAGIVPETGRALWTTHQDSVAIVGPPRYGKTSGLMIPSLYWWAGPAVVASTRGDMLAATGNWRRRIAEPYGGEVLVYDPLGSEPGVSSMQWTPLDGCEDPSVAYRRAAEMTATAASGVTDADHWRIGGARILRGVLHAAAIAEQPLSKVATWVGEHDVREAIDILRASESPARFWSSGLRGLDRLSDKERGSFFSVASQTLDVVDEPAVLASTAASDLDIDRFLQSRSTLYIVSPSHVQAALAPMIVGLVTAITQRAAELAQAAGGRLDPALLVALDEVSNIAPVAGLSGLVSEGAGRGIVTMWADQTLDRLREKYGADQAKAILGASSTKIIFGGLSNDDDLRMFSSWEGEHRESQVTTFAGGAEEYDRLQPSAVGIAEPQDTQRQHSHTWAYRPVLPVERIRQTPEGEALVWYRSDPAVRVATPPAHLIPPFRQLAGYTPTPRALEASP